MPVFERETYNDDRIYVHTVSEVTVHCPGKPARQCWAVTTRRNVRGLPPIWEDDFPTREAAEANKRRHVSHHPAGLARRPLHDLPVRGGGSVQMVSRTGPMAADGERLNAGQHSSFYPDVRCSFMRCKDCAQVRGYPYKRSHLVALRTTKITASNPPSHWWPGER